MAYSPVLPPKLFCGTCNHSQDKHPLDACGTCCTAPDCECEAFKLRPKVKT